MKHFHPSVTPDEGSGILFLFELIDRAVPNFFAPNRPLHVARAPGRLDVMGGFAEHAGAFCLHLPIADAATVAVQRRDDDEVHVWSPMSAGAAQQSDRSQLVSMRLEDLGLTTTPIPYSKAKAFFAAEPRDRWSVYVLGALLVLAHEKGLQPSSGLAVLLHSDVPMQKGVASSAAIEVAAMRALTCAFGIDLDGCEVARLSRLVDTEIVGVAGGALDHIAVALGHADELTVLRGRSDAGDERVRLPADLEIVGLDCGVRRSGAVGGEDAARDFGVHDQPRAERFVELLRQAGGEEVWRELGELMFASHEGYAQSGLGHERSDWVVEQVRQRRAAGAAVFGAKLTGAGGGSRRPIRSTSRAVWHEALRIKKAMLEATGHTAQVIRWSSPGAMEFGVIELQPKPAAAGGS